MAALAGCDDTPPPKRSPIDSYAPAPTPARPELEVDPEKEASKLALEEASEPVEPPWTAAQLRAAIKPGRRWAIRETMTFMVGADRQQKVRSIEAKVKSVGQNSYEILRREFDDKNQLVREGTTQGYFTFEGGTYSRMAREETKVSEEIIEVAGRRWKAKVYRNRRIVDAQEQVMTIWNAVEVPGLALKMVSKSPRMTQTIELTAFDEGA